MWSHLKYFVIWRLTSKEHTIFQLKRQYHLSSDLHQIINWEHGKKFCFICWSFTQVEFQLKKITVTGMQEAQAATFITGRLYKIWTTTISIILWPRNLRAAFAGSFLRASSRTWKTWDLGRATLLITKSCVGGRDSVTSQNRNVTQSARLGSRLRKSAGTPS